MVETSTDKLGAGAIRALNMPLAIEVRESERGYPTVLKLKNVWQSVVIQDIWRIDDDWWRPEAISRVYFRLSLKDGSTPTVFKDLITRKWFNQ